MIKTTTLLASLLLIASASAQVCKTDSIKSSHVEGQYLDNGDGTITDVVNGLVWSKCSLGETIENGECTGSLNEYYTWQDALQSAQANSFIDGKEYRLPNIKELASIVERSCYAPAINLVAFPTTASGFYWSNTPDSQVNILVSPEVSGRIVDFRDGTEKLTEVNDDRVEGKNGFIRLVRSL